MDLITLAVTLCTSLLCIERPVVNSDQNGMTYQQCKIQGQMPLARFMAENPKYASYRIKQWQCIKGTYVPKGEA